MNPAPVLSLPKKDVRKRGATMTLLGVFTVAFTVYDLQSSGGYYPVAMFLYSVLLPMGLWMLLFPGEVEATTGRRTKKWELGLNLCAVAGACVGVLTFYRLGGLAWAGLTP